MKQVTKLKFIIFMVFATTSTVALFYLIINKNNLWDSSIEVKSRFKNIQGLQIGNNVRFGGMHCGTIKDIYPLNDTTIEVVMSINKSIQKYIRKNAKTFISSDGFVGDKLMNISGEIGISSQIVEGDLLQSISPLDLEELLASINSPETGISSLLHKLNNITKKIDESSVLWDILKEKTLSNNFQQIVKDIRQTTDNTKSITNKISSITQDLDEGKGLVGALIKDSIYINKFDSILNNSSRLLLDANQIANNISVTLVSIKKDLEQEDGLVKTVLKDSTFNKKLQESVSSIEEGTKSFNEVMSALKKSIFLRKALKRNEKK
jgi:phospholipid/cholesterol/gamma-HCH transport system substrate-binding protein